MCYKYIIQTNCSYCFTDMLKRISKIDLLLMFTAILTPVASEYIFFSGDKLDAIFIGLWVPSILGFACLLKLIRIKK